jgi:conjugative transfer region lipoprotein (TIGR03751 family)
MTWPTSTITQRWIRFHHQHTRNPRRVATLLTLLILLILSGCTGTPMPLGEETMPTLKHIYTEKMSGKTSPIEPATIHRPIHPADGDLRGQARARYHGLKHHFPFLPNPVLVMYVFPHLTAADTPIPGYATFFKLYATDPVALPHEVSPMSQSPDCEVPQ